MDRSIASTSATVLRQLDDIREAFLLGPSLVGGDPGLGKLARLAGLRSTIVRKDVCKDRAPRYSTTRRPANATTSPTRKSESE
eukprot:11277964-Alexandrium_andersonii.AAC.1